MHIAPTSQNIIPTVSKTTNTAVSGASLLTQNAHPDLKKYFKTKITQTDSREGGEAWGSAPEKGRLLMPNNTPHKPSSSAMKNLKKKLCYVKSTLKYIA